MALPSSEDILPVFDLSSLSANVDNDTPWTNEQQQLCARVAECLRATGCLVVRDPQVTSAHNDQFLDMMERYFGQPREAKMSEARPDVHYQVGVTPSGVEVPRVLVDPNMQSQANSMAEGHKPSMPTGPDLKWRYFWRVGPRPESTKFAELNAEPMVPKAFPEWQQVMDGWGSKMVAVAEKVAVAAAAGLGLERDAFVSRMRMGPHLLAPTGSDLGQHGQLGNVFAGFHYDLNFLTLHGRSRFPGLFVWLRDGRRVPVRIPEGCLFVQAGKQLEWLTGGDLQAGLHEVIVTEDTLRAVDAARAAGRSLWRVSSTVFSHIASDQLLTPLGRFAGSAQAKYPPTLAGEQVNQELTAISLRKGGRSASAKQLGGGADEQEGSDADAVKDNGSERIIIAM